MYALSHKLKRLVAVSSEGRSVARHLKKAIQPLSHATYHAAAAKDFMKVISHDQDSTNQQTQQTGAKSRYDITNDLFACNATLSQAKNSKSSKDKEEEDPHGEELRVSLPVIPQLLKNKDLDKRRR